MNRFDANWQRLVASARRAPTHADPPAPLDRERVRALVAAALAAPRDDLAEWRWEPRWMAAAAALIAALALGLWRSDAPVAETVRAFTDQLAQLPRELPRAPRLPRFDLPSPTALLAALPDVRELRAWPANAAAIPSRSSTAPEHSP